MSQGVARRLAELGIEAECVNTGSPDHLLKTACLSGAEGERLGNGPEWAQPVCGSRGVPVVVAGQRDVFPAERGDVGEQLVGYVGTL